MGTWKPPRKHDVPGPSAKQTLPPCKREEQQTQRLKYSLQMRLTHPESGEPNFPSSHLPSAIARPHLRS